MNLKKIMLLSPKGGAGKSTTSNVLAGTLQYHYGKQVLYVSTDRQYTIGNIRKRDLYLLENDAYENNDERFVVTNEDEMFAIWDTVYEHVFSNLLPDKKQQELESEGGVDYIIFDTPGHLDAPNYKIAQACDLILIPLKIAVGDLLDFAKTQAPAIKETLFKQDDSFKNKVYVFPTAIDMRESATKDFFNTVNEFEATYGIKVLLPGLNARADY
jgi:cellulose biosynthesis protein BcsQ